MKLLNINELIYVASTLAIPLKRVAQPLGRALKNECAIMSWAVYFQEHLLCNYYFIR